MSPWLVGVGRTRRKEAGWFGFSSHHHLVLAIVPEFGYSGRRPLRDLDLPEHHYRKALHPFLLFDRADAVDGPLPCSNRCGEGRRRSCGELSSNLLGPGTCQPEDIDPWQTGQICGTPSDLIEAHLPDRMAACVSGDPGFSNP